MTHVFLAIMVFLSLCANCFADCCGKVIKITDGDTVWLLCDGASEKTKVRLDGIDAPESAQEYGKESAEFAAKLVAEKQVCLVEKGKDKYGRTLGVVITPDLKILNNELVKEGFAWHYKAYSKDANLADLETKAREQKLGLWKNPAPKAPWDYRHPKVTETSPPSKSANNPTARDVGGSSMVLPKNQAPETEIVYITKSGKKYHRSGCTYLQKSAIPISLKDAKEKYTPCSKCN
jgi:endonuclease YncB( thermonuclease family)